MSFFVCGGDKAASQLLLQEWLATSQFNYYKRMKACLAPELGVGMEMELYYVATGYLNI